MKLFKLTALTISVALLTACGGSGGGSGTAQTPDNDKINLTLSPQGSVVGYTEHGILRGQNNSASFYGVWRDNVKEMFQLRYQGTEATNIPTSGTARYVGDAVWLSNNLLSGTNNDFAQGGKTTLNVDFGNKTVDGAITFSVFKGDELRRDITLEKGTLSGAKFAGQATVIGNADGRYEGALFGENAKEAAGLVQFKNEPNLNVSFGGVKQ